jgi:hypothetical protein
VEKALSERIAALVAAHQAGTGCHGWQQDMAVRFAGLAVYGDIGGALIIRPDGLVLNAGWDDETASEACAGWRLIAFAAASHRFPELADLAPERSPTAHSCSGCGGLGCEWCFGIGWLPDIIAEPSV